MFISSKREHEVVTVTDATSAAIEYFICFVLIIITLLC